MTTDNWQWKLLATWKTLPKVDPHYNFYLHVHGSFWHSTHTWPVCKPGAGLSTQTMRAPITRWGWLLWQPVQERNWVQQPSSSLHMLFKGTPVIENKQCIAYLGDGNMPPLAYHYTTYKTANGTLQIKIKFWTFHINWLHLVFLKLNLYLWSIQTTYCKIMKLLDLTFLLHNAVAFSIAQYSRSDKQIHVTDH